MVKEVHFFTEMAYSAYSQEAAKQAGYTNLMFPNENFDPSRAGELYNMYFEEFQYASEAGFDGMMINEHHYNPLCMMPAVNLIGSVLARTTKKGKIVFLGNVLPIHENPVRVAEEVSMVDVMSGGRVICGFVRGVGQESMATNSNPVHNRERFDEAHDVIIKTWTTPGPFRWEGKHFQYRVINPWMMPLQKPHPPIWIPGVASPESIVWAARHRYPYVALAPPEHLLKGVYDLYNKTAKEEGYTATSDNRGYAIRIACADTDEEAYELGRHWYWQLGTSFGVAPRHWQAPPGYLTKAAVQGAIQQQRNASRQVDVTPGGPVLEYDQAQETYQVVTGNPDTVLKKLRHLMDIIDPANVIFWAREGGMPHKDAMRNIELLGAEVIPALKEYEPHRDE